MQKQGRPKKKNNYKVELMNRARLLKREQMKKNDNLNIIVVEEEVLEPVKKKAKTEHVKEMTDENSVKTIRKIRKTAADTNSKIVTQVRVTRKSKCKEHI